MQTSAWQSAEATQRAGRPSSSDSGKVRFEHYVDEQWFPNHVLEPSTRESYRYCLNRHILPWFGPMRMRDILPIHVREWVTELGAAGVSPAQVRHLKIILSAVFTTALNDFVVVLHPCRGVKTPTVPVKEYRIVTPVEFETLLVALPSDTARLLIDVALGSGLRWGELTELRPADLHVPSGIVTVTRAVAEVNPKYHPDGERFLVKPYPKNKRSRRFKLDPDLVAAITAHIAAHRLAPSDLLFRFDTFLGPVAAPRPLMPADQLGRTEPNAAGRRYPHGTLSAYTAGTCRCVHCRAAFANYRAERRAGGLDSPAPAADARQRRAPATRMVPQPGLAARLRREPASTRGRDFTTCATPTPRGCSPGERTFKSSRSDSATAASRPPASTCTRCPPPTRPRSPRSGGSVEAHDPTSTLPERSWWLRTDPLACRSPARQRHSSGWADVDGQHRTSAILDLGNQRLIKSYSTMVRPDVWTSSRLTHTVLGSAGAELALGNVRDPPEPIRATAGETVGRHRACRLVGHHSPVRPEPLAGRHPRARGELSSRSISA